MRIPYLFLLLTFLSIGQTHSQEKRKIPITATLSDILETTLASTVTVAVYKTDYANNQLMSRGNAENKISQEAYRKALDLGEFAGAGSGFVVQINGKKYAITNYHVIANASRDAGSIKVFSISRRQYEMKLVGGDSFYDVAVLEFVDKAGSEVRSVKFRSAEIRIGEKVFAIGNPGGNHPFSVSDGMISAKNRVLEGLTSKFGYLQTTATVIWGNSGGPLVDEHGQVAGINTRIDFATGNDGSNVWTPQINYALEASIAERIVTEVINNKGRVIRSYLGIEFSKKSPWSDDNNENDAIQTLMEPPSISGLLPNSPASSVMKGFIGWNVMQVNGEEIRNMEELLGALEQTKPSQNIEFLLQKDSVTSSKVVVRSGELKGEQLDAIARYLFDKEATIKMRENIDKVNLELQPSRFQINDAGTVTAVGNQNLIKIWRIVAAGIGESLYKVISLSDLGAAIKLTSLSGALDVKMIPETDDETVGEDGVVDNIRAFRYIFSGEQDSLESLLYY